MISIYDELSKKCSKETMLAYSTSFSLGTFFLSKSIRSDIYAIYGFVRLADEIVDSFHAHNQAELLSDFVEDTRKAIARGISLNPILHSFQQCVRCHGIEEEVIEAFLHSMRLDLTERSYGPEEFKDYVYGSAEAVGLMCLRVFANGDSSFYERHSTTARALGSAFQKVNFLRDLRHDCKVLDRRYFPHIDPQRFSGLEKKQIEEDISNDFALALQGVSQLPVTARFGVYLAYLYYQALFKKLCKAEPSALMTNRLRISSREKLVIFVRSCLRYCLVGVK